MSWMLAAFLLPALVQGASAPPTGSTGSDTSEVDEFFGLFDSDKDGAVTQVEFLNGVDGQVKASGQTLPPDAQQSVVSAFKSMDTDGDGRATRSELQALQAAVKKQANQ